MDMFELAQLLAQREQAQRLYLEFLRVPTLSMGLYVLPTGGVDPQQPHAEDEVYYVVGGRGFIQVGAEDRPVQAGTMAFVPAQVSHRFHTITEELKLLVFFAPAEGSQSAPGRN
jgi:mannose-6-phosphate isomerase-like protein (cupin superfamily)